MAPTDVGWDGRQVDHVDLSVRPGFHGQGGHWPIVVCVRDDRLFGGSDLPAVHWRYARTRVVEHPQRHLAKRPDRGTLKPDR